MEDLDLSSEESELYIHQAFPKRTALDNDEWIEDKCEIMQPSRME